MRAESRRVRDIFDREAPIFDRREAIAEWLLLAERRCRLLARARGEVLEVAVGTGRNVPYYPPVARVTAIDLSCGMLAQARRRFDAAGRPARLTQGEAERLPFPSARFDTVVSSLSLCIVPTPQQALAEMVRVCRPDGRLLLLEHVRGEHRLVGGLLDRLEPWQVQRFGCHPNRRTVELVESLGLSVRVLERHLWGTVVTLEARRKPSEPRP